MDGKLAGKTTVVTGGSRGIGFGIARELALNGCRVAIAGRNPDALESAISRLKGEGLSVSAKSCDISDDGEVREFFESVRQHFSSLDFLINNAGAAHALANVERLAPKEFRRVVDVNLTGTFLCCRAGIPLMGPGAVIVNNLSVAAHQACAGNSRAGAHSRSDGYRHMATVLA